MTVPAAATAATAATAAITAITATINKTRTIMKGHTNQHDDNDKQQDRSHLTIHTEPRPSPRTAAHSDPRSPRCRQ